MEQSRRRFLRTSLGLTLVAAGPAWATGRMPTPRQSAGPFYPPELPLDQDNDLVHVAGRAVPAQGRIADLGGQLLDRNGAPLKDVRIEIWQCDANGRYRHPRDPGKGPGEWSGNDSGPRHRSRCGRCPETRGR